jgi:hypothetical protein
MNIRKWRVAAPALPLTNLLSKSTAILLTMLTWPGAGSAAELALRPRPRVAHVPTCSDFVLSCENGRTYQFCPRAISDWGDVVTGTLSAGHRGVPMRLVPMGVGYRYAGPGIWFEGYGSDAVLNFGAHHSVACTVTRTSSETSYAFPVD